MRDASAVLAWEVHMEGRKSPGLHICGRAAASGMDWVGRNQLRRWQRTPGRLTARTESRCIEGKEISRKGHVEARG